LLQRALQDSAQSIVKNVGIVATTHSARVRLSTIFSLLSSGQNEIGGKLNLSSTNTLNSVGSRVFNGQTLFTHSYNTYTTPSMNLAGFNDNSIVVILNSDGSIMGQHYGGTNLLAAINLLANGNLTISSSSLINNIYGLNSFGSRNFNGDTQLLTEISSVFSGQKDLHGSANFPVIFELEPVGSRNVFGQSNFVNNYNVNSRGNLIFGQGYWNEDIYVLLYKAANLVSEFTLTSDGYFKIDVPSLEFNLGLNAFGNIVHGPDIQLNNVYSLRSVGGGEITTLYRIRNIVFPLNIQQRQTFELPITKRKNSTLIIR
jgi:hypothetical protein